MAETGSLPGEEWEKLAEEMEAGNDQTGTEPNAETEGTKKDEGDTTAKLFERIARRTPKETVGSLTREPRVNR